jgi:hypothetical protein
MIPVHSNNSHPHYFYFTCDSREKTVSFIARDWPTTPASSQDQVVCLLPMPIIGQPLPLSSTLLDPVFQNDFGKAIKQMLSPLQIQHFENLFLRLATLIKSDVFDPFMMVPVLDSLKTSWLAHTQIITTHSTSAIVLSGMTNTSPLSFTSSCIVAIYPEKPTIIEPFWLGHVLEVTGKMIKILWFDYNKKHKTWKIDPIVFEKGKPYELIPYDSVMLHNIELTPKYTLPNLIHKLILQACILHKNALQHQAK